MIVEYNLTSPYLAGGEYQGWCDQWQHGSDFGDSFWINLSKDECWSHCEDDSSCYQAVYEVGEDDGRQCWIGTNKMTSPPNGFNRPGVRIVMIDISRVHNVSDLQATDICYAKEINEVQPVFIMEEKFISNDVVSTIMISDRPVTLKISGRSFQVKPKSLS